MRLNLGTPYAGMNIGHVTQIFGVNAANYAKYNLIGHNGVDYGIAVGTPLTAVDGGIVAEVADDPSGYGLYVKLVHPWGETLYAHMSQQDVGVGQSVAKGQRLGLSGNTGNSSGPHLHFGLRVNPYLRDDGYVGYSNPYPYLHEKPSNAVMGPHIINGVTPHLDLLKRWQPRLVLVMEPHADEIAKLKAVCPHTVIVARLYRPDSEVRDRIKQSPIAAAKWAHEATMERMIPGVDFWQIQNEVLQSYSELPMLDLFEREHMRLAKAAGYRCGIMAFGVVNPDMPDNDPLALWRQVDTSLSMAEADGHALILHQYGKPTVQEPDPAKHAFRFEMTARLRLKYRRLRVAVTEFGIDGLLYSTDGKPKGWTGFTNADDYANQLIAAGDHLDQYRQVLGYCVFTLGHNDPWGSYDIAGPVANKLADHYAATRGQSNVVIVTDPEPPVDKPKEAPVVTKARISNGALQLGVQVEAILNPGQYYVKDVFTVRQGKWDLSNVPYSIDQWARDVYLKAGNDPDYMDEGGADHFIFVKVIDEQGNPVNVDVDFWTETDGKIDPGNAKTRNTFEKRSKWANLDIWQSFSPERGERGPWHAAPHGAAEEVNGMGLPLNIHVSTFIVFEKRTAVVTPPIDPVKPPVDPVKLPTEAPKVQEVTVTQTGTIVRIKANVPYTIEVANG